MRSKIWPLLAISVSVAFLVFLLTFFSYQRGLNLLELWKEEYVKSAAENVTSQIAFEGEKARLVVEALLRNREVIEAFTRGDRERLIELLMPLHELYRKELGLLQIHFHTAEVVSFLRTADLSRYGDDLKEFRKDILHVRNTRKATSSMSMGVMGPNIRYIAPIIVEGEYRGSVEANVSLVEGFIKKIKDEAIIKTFFDERGNPRTVLAKSQPELEDFTGIFNRDDLLQGNLQSFVQGDYTYVAIPLHDFTGRVFAVIFERKNITHIVENERKQKKLMSFSTLAMAIVGGMITLLLGIVSEQRWKLKILDQETKYWKLQQAVFEVTQEYLKGKHAEEMYQFLLEKAIEAIPHAQGGSVLVKRDGQYRYVAAVGYDLAELANFSFDDQEVEECVKQRVTLRRRGNFPHFHVSCIDTEKAKKSQETKRSPEIQCSIVLAVEAKGEIVALFNIDNFENEKAFNVEALKTAELFASYVGMLFVRVQLEWEIEKQRKEMEYLSHHDPLTGLPNRRMFQEYGEKILALAERQKKEVMVAFLDLTKFKDVNDTFGHALGDELLKTVGTRLAKTIRHNDIAARFGGDEFVLLIYDCNHSCAHTFLQRVLTTIEKPIAITSQENVKISANIGVAFYPQDGTNLDALVRAADSAMYVAKKQGVPLIFFQHTDHRVDPNR